MPDEPDPRTPAAAIARLRDPLRIIHPQASEIITAPAALEVKVDRLLRRFLAPPDKLPRLSMEHRLGVLKVLLNDS